VTICVRLMSRVRRVCSRMLSLKRAMAFGGDAPPRFPFAGEAESEKLSLPRSGHCALRLIYLRFELVRDPARLIPAARQSRFTIAPCFARLLNLLIESVPPLTATGRGCFLKRRNTFF